MKKKSFVSKISRREGMLQKTFDKKRRERRFDKVAIVVFSLEGDKIMRKKRTSYQLVQSYLTSTRAIPFFFFSSACVFAVQMEKKKGSGDDPRGGMWISCVRKPLSLHTWGRVTPNWLYRHKTSLAKFQPLSTLHFLSNMAIFIFRVPRISARAK